MSLVGIGIVMVKAFEIPRYWLPLLVGLALFLAGALCWATGKHE